MNLPKLQDKYRTIYIKQLTAQDKDKYETEINNAIAAAIKKAQAEAREKALKEQKIAF
jgi:hypothetical protein